MKLIFVIGIAAIVIGLIGVEWLKKISKENTPEKLPYLPKKTLLHEEEQKVFFRLIEAMPEYYVMAQVRLADIVEIKKGASNRQAWKNKISQKSVDFVIIDKSTKVLACIEFDGKTHEREDRQKADGSKDAALNAAGIPIIRIQANKLPSNEILKKYLEDKILQRKPPSVDS